MTSDAMTPTEGEVVALEEDGARVRLDGGTLGLLPRSAGASLTVGARRTFRVEGRGQGGEVILAVVTPSPGTPTHSFDQEFDRLQDALANHGPRSIHQPEHNDTIGKEQIEGWMKRTTDHVTRLRKRRAKRLNEQT